MLLVSCIVAGVVQWCLLVPWRAGIVTVSVVNALFLIWVGFIVAAEWPIIPWQVMGVVGVILISTVMALGQRKK